MSTLQVIGNVAPGTAQPVFQWSQVIKGKSRKDAQMMVSDLHGIKEVNNKEDEAKFWAGLKRCIRPGNDQASYRRKTVSKHSSTRFQCDNGFTSIWLQINTPSLLAGQLKDTNKWSNE
jgi:hypothetical protein